MSKCAVVNVARTPFLPHLAQRLQGPEWLLVAQGWHIYPLLHAEHVLGVQLADLTAPS